MQLPIRSFAQLVQDMSASLQGSVTGLVDLTVGSVLRSILEANASVALWLQWMMIRVLQTTRAATSTGTDLDTWMDDFSVARLAAIPAVGQITFSRYATSQQATVPLGTVVKTTDGLVAYQVTCDTSLPSWSAAANAYIMPPAVGSLTLPVAAVVAGAGGNLGANTITRIGTTLPGIDAATNTLPMSGGCDAETDDALRSRFQKYLASLWRATPAAIGFAILGLQQGLSFHIDENVTAGGIPRQGSFLITIDDGSGAPPQSVLNAVSNVVESYRPIGSTFCVQPPLLISAAVTVSVQWKPGVSVGLTAQTVSDAISRYIEQLTIGESLSVSRVILVAFQSSDMVDDVLTVAINGQSSELAAGPTSVIRPSAVTVS
jgi:uncharacterized phage protein gp47/JayE